MYKIFEELLKRDGVTVADVCRATGIKQSTMSNWKRRNNRLSQKNAKKVADFFNVTLDYLYGSEGDDISQSVRVRQVFETMLRLNGWEVEYYDPTEGRPCADCPNGKSEDNPWWANAGGTEPQMLCDKCVIGDGKYIIRNGSVERVFTSKEYEVLINRSQSDAIESLLNFDKNDSGDGVYRIPVVRRVAAGQPLDTTDDVIAWVDLPEDMRDKGTYFGLRIKGSSMSPNVNDGDIVICRKQDDAESGEIVVVLIGDGNDGVCKRLKKYDDGSVVLISDNPLYEPIHCDANNIPHIRGVVKELRRRF